MVTTQDRPEGERLTRVEAIIESLVREVTEIKADIRQLRSEMSELRTEMRELRSKIDSNFHWTLGIVIGILIPMWASIVLAIFFR
jgi:predicted RNase H-like nuclease (RuvC/YqgF family)